MHATPLPLLYTYRRCPYAMRARMALLWAGVGFQAYEIVLRHKPSGLLAASAKGTVPVLVLPTGEVLEESWDIVRWALNTPAAPSEARAAWDMAQSQPNLHLLHTNDGAFKHHLDRYKYPERFAAAAGPTASPAALANAPADTPEATSGEPVAAALRQQHRAAAVHCLLEPLEQRLQAAPFLGGAQPCATDVAVFPFVRQFAAVEPAWFNGLPLPHLRAWLLHWLGSPWFGACMVKLPADQAVPYPPWAQA